MGKTIFIDPSVENSSNLKKHLERDEEIRVSIIPYGTTGEFAKVHPGQSVLVIKEYTGSEQITVLNNWRLHNPQLLCIFLTNDHADDNLLEMLNNGINGLLAKNSALCVVVDGIHQVFNGGMPVTAKLSQHLFKKLRSQQLVTAENPWHLTQREIQILDLLSKGFLYKEIALGLQISLLTVKNHLKNSYRKLKVKNRSEAIITYLGINV